MLVNSIHTMMLISKILNSGGPMELVNLIFMTSKLDYIRKEIHKKLKDFACSFCESKFARKSDLKQHVKRKHYLYTNVNHSALILFKQVTKSRQRPDAT